MNISYEDFGNGELTLALHDLVKSLSQKTTSAQNVEKKINAFVICAKENLKGFLLFRDVFLFIAHFILIVAFNVGFIRGVQMDAHDFLILLLDHIDTALVRNQFVGSMNCISRCTNENCKFESVKQEQFTALTLRIPSISPCDLNDCLQMFEKEESLEVAEVAKCSCCDLDTVSERKLCVTSWNSVLVIQLSRFSRLEQDRKDSQSEHRRLNTPISFPLIGFNVGSEDHPIVYDCYAVCNHFGSCTKGHYTAHALRGNIWFHFDDVKKPVEIRNPQNTIGEKNSSAYILFYERRPFISIQETTCDGATTT